MHNQESDQVNTKISNSVSQLLKLNNNKGTVYLISGPK